MDRYSRRFILFSVILLVSFFQKSVQREPDDTSVIAESPSQTGGRLMAGVMVPAGYKYHEGDEFAGFYKLHPYKEAWFAAKATCEREGGHLIVINSEEEAALALDLFNRRGPSLHVGATDFMQTGSYVTILDQTLEEAGFDAWAEGQPELAGAHCVYLDQLDGKLYESYCDSARSYVCEIPV